MAVIVRRLAPSSPPHWQVVVQAPDVFPGDSIALVDDATAIRPGQAARVVLVGVQVSDAAGGCTSATPSLVTTDADPGLLNSVLTLDPVAAGDWTAQAVWPHIPYAVHPDGPIYLRPGLDAGTATITATVLIVGGWE